MQKLTQKTTILFSPDIYRQLQDFAKVAQTSVAELIRNAVIKQYLLLDKNKRVEAVKHLSQIGGPVSDWDILEDEITKGRFI